MTKIPSLVNLFSPSNIVIFMLVFVRLTGLMQSMPFISTIRAPQMSKVWFAATIAFIFYPLVQASKNFILPNGMLEFSILIIFEFLIGYLIGFVANLLFEGVRMSGNILSIQMGLSMSQALDPVTGVHATEISNLYIYLTTLIFLSTGAYQMVFIALFNSFNALPIGTFAVMDANLVSGLLTMFASLFKISFGVALPIFSVLLISDVLLGMMSKMMPHMNIYMVALPVKIYIGMFLLLAFLGATGTYLKNVIENYMKSINFLFT